MGRRRTRGVADLRSDWVYVGRQEAAVLAGVAPHLIDRWVLADELEPRVLDREISTGRRRLLYRLSDVLERRARRGR